MESTNFNNRLEHDTKKGDFYSVFIPADIRPKNAISSNFVFEDKLEALKTVKKAKTARFKHFDNYNDAISFATVGIIDATKPEHPPIPSERSAFKGLSPQELVKLRKSIEIGDLDFFRNSIWTNPRYLISSGDTPSILQEGFRYNALHIAAKSKNGMMAELILSTISNPTFIQLLYGDDTPENIENRIEVLLDLYLNTPDKGFNETPLHFSVKFGAVDVVEVLVSFPQCDKNLKNKHGQTPDMIICDRCDKKDAIVAKKIASYLENNFYVPVLRSDDNTLPPVIGEPFSPGRHPRPNSDPLSPRLEIHAYAGPMNKEGADQFRKVWKTPPRTSTPIKKRPENAMESLISMRFTDTSKGLERLGQKLASQFDVTWKEYWPFLDCFIDLTSEGGLTVLERYLAEKVAITEKVDSITPDSPVDDRKSLSSIADLCLHMQNCNLSDSFIEDSDFSRFLCVERACNVFANRLASEITNRVGDSFHTQVSHLEIQTKQVELLALSYMDDPRFNSVNLGVLHARLGLLTGQKLCFCINSDGKSRLGYIKAINKFINECTKAFDCFSSDDEGNNYAKSSKPTTSKKQLICLMQNVANHFTGETNAKVELDSESACKEAWSAMKECNCVFHYKKTRRTLGLSRSNSLKHKLLNDISRKLFHNECEHSIDEERAVLEDCSSDDEFFTPPSTPPFYDFEEYSEAGSLMEVFIEGVEPTKTDCAVYKTFRLADCDIDKERFPSVYRWYHNVGLYSQAERDNWGESKCVREQLSNSQCFTPPARPQPNRSSQMNQSPTSNNSWLRITGVSSPRASQLNKRNI